MALEPKHHRRNTGPMLASPRCGARTRSGQPCRAPVVNGKKRCRMHGGAPGSGAPRGNQNAQWVEIVAHADPLYQHLIVTAERKFWRCVESGEQPQLLGIEPPKPRLEAVRVVDMASSNAWAEFAAVFTRTHQAHFEHEQAKAELKSLMPEDAKEAIGHGVKAKRSKSGAISFDLAPPESSYAAV